MEFKASEFSKTGFSAEDRRRMHLHNSHHRTYKMLLKFFAELDFFAPGLAYVLPIFKRATIALLNSDLQGQNSTIMHQHEI
jgi:hypothetical protein